MSITITTDVFCDRCKMAWIHCSTHSHPRRQLSRRIAQAEGWTRKLDRDFNEVIDLCPDCSKGES